MSKFGFLGRKPGMTMAVLGQTASNDIAAGDAKEADKEIDVDDELFSPMAVKLGGEHEALRNLLVNAGYRIGELDSIKDAFEKLVDPVNKALQSLEREKAEKLGLQSVLTDTRAAFSKLRTAASEHERKSTTLDTECARLRDELAATQQALRTAETARTEQTTELVTRRQQIMEVERRLQREIKDGESLREENRRNSQRLAATDKKIVALEAETEASRQKLLLSEKDRTALQSALDQAVAEASRSSRRMIEAENGVTTAHNRLRQIETNFTEVNTERARLSIALQEANERHQSEINSHRMRFEALQSRAATTDKLLNEARESLALRADEIRGYERRVSEATSLHSSIESKLIEIEAAHTERDAQLRELEQSRLMLSERAAGLGQSLKARDGALSRADETIQTLNDRVAMLEAQLNATQQSFEEQLEDLTSTLQRERVERAISEGALESGRKDLARLVREVAELQRRGMTDDPERAAA